MSLVTLVAGAVCLGIYNERDFQPPAATTTTNKGAKIAGIPASQITVTSSSHKRLNADLVTEAHITSTREQAYALELRKQMDQPLLDCEPESADCPAELLLCFDFNAPVKSVTISLDFGLQVSPAHVYFYGPSGAAVELDDSHGKPASDQLTRLPKPEGSDFRIMVHVKQLLSMSWPSDTGFTRPLIRVGVTPSAPNTASSGPYFALRLPLVRTLQSNTSMVVEHPEAGEPRLLHPVTGFRQKREIIDETGQAQLSSGVAPDLASTVPPSRFGDDFSPAILYTDQVSIWSRERH
ncbi:hypothetical protein [Leifsonia shinshuensis]|uniref:Uncharacterized protein n=1 Tax=Leifsonia shinshuensis TaxID=150026 RepID=A0A853D055_9MICO|nr:hypothetical protein [Leifsonia shinshuensis]NYJ24921.1 hypothetical protein [Leifsonia shinshuensis]